MKKAALFALLGIGCATIPPQPLKYDRSQETIHEAAALGAERVPTARLHLQRANTQLDLARQMENAKDTRAALMLACAQADAEVAVALAREAAMHREVVQSASEIANLRGAQ